VGSLAQYLAYPRRSVALLQTLPALRLAVRDQFQQLARDNVIYAEIRFAPLLHCEAGLTPEEVVDAISRECNAAAIETGVQANLILCTLRHFSPQQSLATAQLAQQFRQQGVVALDLAGSEAEYALDAHVEAFDYAKKHDIQRIAHAGEACGPHSVRETLDRLAPSRIGHGVRSIEEPALVEQLVETGIHLEVCPTCNIQTGIVSRLEDHPIHRLYRSGVSLGVNTDTRTVTWITLTQEYEKLAQTFGWQRQDFLNANRMALRASFAADNQKEELDELLRRA
jgi:adenosine deaminase